MRLQIKKILMASACILTLGMSAGHAEDLGAIWFIGDSITQSNADGDSSSSPRKSLYDLLTANGFSFTYTGHHTKNTGGLPKTGASISDNLYHYHSGISGYRIGEIGVVEEDTRVIAPNLTSYWTSGRLAVVKPNIILIMLGTNDVNYQDGAPVRLKQLIENIYALPDVGTPTIYLASIPPNGRNPDYPVAFNSFVPGIVYDFQAAGKGIHYVDQFTPLNDDYGNTMRRDNLHPNATGNDVIAQNWFNAITSSVNVEGGQH